MIAAFLALVAGGLQALSLAWPFDWPLALRGQSLWWLQLLALATLAGLLQASATPRQAAWRGWLFATAWLLGSFSWIFVSLHRYGALPAVLALLAVLALAALLALYYGAAAWCFNSLAPAGQVKSVLTFAALWLLAELARGSFLTGFGWGAIAYAQLDGPLAGGYAWIGGYGVAALAAALSAWLASALASFLAAYGPSAGRAASGAAAPRWRAAIALLGAGVVLWGLVYVPAPPSRSSGTLSVTLLQGNIAQEEKFAADSGVPKALNWYAEQLMQSRSELVVTAETALALLPDQLPEGYWRALQQRFAHAEQAALIGMPLGSYAAGYTNSVVGLKPMQNQFWRYDKHHLVPFGEFIPPLFRWFTAALHIPLGDFKRGALAQPTFDWHGQRLAASICYETLFSEELAVQFAPTERAPTVLVNISNLGWFGEHLAMDQHLQIARVRALEFARPFVLASNTGHSAIVDYQGQVTQRAPAHRASVLRARVQGRSGVTPYAAWQSRWGLAPLVWLALLALAGCQLQQRWRSVAAQARVWASAHS